MRIAFVIILFFAAYPFFAQVNQADTWLEESRILMQKRQYPDAIKKTLLAANAFRKNGKQIQHINALLELTYIYLLADENYEAKKMATKILRNTSKKDTLAASAYQLLGRYRIQAMPISKKL